MENHLDGYFRLLSRRFSSAFSDSAFFIARLLEHFPDTPRALRQRFCISPRLVV